MNKWWAEEMRAAGGRLSVGDPRARKKSAEPRRGQYAPGHRKKPRARDLQTADHMVHENFDTIVREQIRAGYANF